MTYMSDARPVSYMGDGVQLPGEDDHQAGGENTAYNLGGHLLNGPAQGVSVGTFSQPGEPTADAHPMAAEQPGHGFQDEPLNQAERAAQRTAQTVAADTHGQAPVYSLSHAEVAGNARAAFRGGVV